MSRRRRSMGNRLGVGGGLVLWLDAADPTTITSSSGSASIWASKLGNYAITQDSGTAQPKINTRTQNGLRVMDFDGNDDLMSSASTINAKMIFAVAQADTDSVDRAGLINATGTDMENIRRRVGGGFVGDGLNGEDANDFTYQNGEIRINNVVSVTTTNDVPFILSAITENDSPYATFALQVSQDSSSRFWNGWVGEILVYDRELSNEDRNRVYNYLSNKWGI